MAKGDDIKLRKKNKGNRKKLQKDPSSVSARVAALIAAKKCRKTGKRRICRGMCFGLPTPEDPFNDRHGKLDVSMNKMKKPCPKSKNKASLKDNGSKQKRTPGNDQLNTNHKKAKRLKQMELENGQKTSLDNLVTEKNTQLGKRQMQSLGKDVVPDDWEEQTSGYSACPSKFLFMCLNSIQGSLLGGGELNKEQDKPLFVNSWGVEFWRFYSLGNDILENSAASPSMQQIAWMASTAADTIAKKDKEGISFTSPFLLYLVPSQEKAVKVRSVCKPLKALGIHTVSLHPGASVEHQIHGLKSCEPEFLIATPERLWELVSLKALDISGASLLVVDGMDSLSHCFDVVKCVNDSLSGDHQIVVFQVCNSACTQVVQNILREPVHIISLGESIKSKVSTH